MRRKRALVALLLCAGSVLAWPALTSRWGPDGYLPWVSYPATDEMAGVVWSWPGHQHGTIDARLRGQYQTIREDVERHPEFYVGYYHTGDQVTVDVPRGMRDETIARWDAQGLDMKGVAVTEVDAQSAAVLYDITKHEETPSPSGGFYINLPLFDTIPDAESARIDWERHYVLVEVTNLSDEVRRNVKAAYGDAVVLDLLPIAPRQSLP